MTLVHLHEAKTSEYWRSPEGMMRRIEMLSQSFTYKIVNSSLMFYGYSAGITRVRWATRADERVCPICGPLEGRIYQKGQFLPRLPAHAGCRCGWELMFDPLEVPEYLRAPPVGSRYFPPGVKVPETLKSQVQKHLDKLPVKHTRQLKRVDIVPEIRTLYTKDGDIITGQWRKDGSIQLSLEAFASGRDYSKTLYHEVGHNVYFTATKGKMDDPIWSWFWKQKQADMPSGYAKMNAVEGFAECYASIHSKEQIDLLISDVVKIFGKEPTFMGEAFHEYAAERLPSRLAAMLEQRRSWYEK